jgi:hypothetical protein
LLGIDNGIAEVLAPHLTMWVSSSTLTSDPDNIRIKVIDIARESHE